MSVMQWSDNTLSGLSGLPGLPHNLEAALALAVTATAVAVSQASPLAITQVSAVQGTVCMQQQLTLWTHAVTHMPLARAVADGSPMQ